ncbi:MAG: hypothetical protein H0X30_00075 [Anaerolineae bacterium]|nr:hypothetical protein [Anaerolineae bacterium]
MINVAKLHRELVEAGIPIEGVADTDPPRIDFLPEATAAQKKQAQAVLAKHDPNPSIEEQRRDAYLKAFTVEDFMEAFLQERFDDHPEKMKALGAIRDSLKAQFPAEGGK